MKLNIVDLLAIWNGLNPDDFSHSYCLWPKSIMNKGFISELKVSVYIKYGCVRAIISPIGCCPPPFAKAGHIKTHSSVRLSLCLSVTKTLTWLISFEILMIEHWYLACTILVTSPFNWYYAVTLTFDLLQGQSCCRAGDHNSPNLLVDFLQHLPWLRQF